MNDYKWTHSKEDLDDWDEFLTSTSRGHYLQTSQWLDSYSSYGFTHEVLIVRDEKGSIVAGLGVVLAKALVIKLYSCACGPIISHGHDHLFDKLIIRFKKRAKSIGATSYQINIPILKENNEDLNPFSLNNELNKNIFSDSYSGNIIKSIIATNGFREVKIDYNTDLAPLDYVFKQFNSNTKRNVKKALKSDLSLRYAKTDNEIEDAYKIIEANGQSQGYSVRSWSDFKDSLIAMVKKDICLIPVCVYKNDIKGVLIVLDIGKRLNYISGGTVRDENDLKVGHFLHYQMLKLSIDKKYKFYDISVGGSEGVTRFKEGFGGKHVEFIQPKYWINNRMLFTIYTKLLPRLKKNKKLVSKLLKLVK